jgi:hypothetical protein
MENTSGPETMTEMVIREESERLRAKAPTLPVRVAVIEEYNNYDEFTSSHDCLVDANGIPVDLDMVARLINRIGKHQ